MLRQQAPPTSPYSRHSSVAEVTESMEGADNAPDGYNPPMSHDGEDHAPLSGEGGDDEFANIKHALKGKQSGVCACVHVCMCFCIVPHNT